MMKKTVTYTDYNGVEKTETFYFGLTESELVKMQMSEYGQMQDRLRNISSSKDAAKIMDQFADLLRLSYGVKTPDGRFVKKRNGELLFDEFESSAAYDAIFMELCTSTDAVVEFAKGILPDNMKAEAEKAMNKELKALKKEDS